jgi:hypothetical protein
LPGQHFGEEALTFNATGPVPGDLLSAERAVPPAAPRVMRARLAYPSRTVVRMTTVADFVEQVYCDIGLVLDEQLPTKRDILIAGCGLGRD